MKISQNLTELSAIHLEILFRNTLFSTIPLGQEEFHRFLEKSRTHCSAALAVYHNIALITATQMSAPINTSSGLGNLPSTNLFVLSAGNLNHTLAGRMLNSNLSEYSIPIVSHDYTTHWVHEHFQHSSWTKTCPYDVRDGFACLDVAFLHFPAGLSFRILTWNNKFKIFSQFQYVAKCRVG